MSMTLGSVGKKQRTTPTINVTPLVDVVLVVLIIFMITVVMVTKTFWLNLPKSEKDQPATPNDNKPLVLTVHKDGTIWANTTTLTKAELRAGRVLRMLAAKDQKVLYFDAQNDVEYRTAMEAMDLTRAGGVKSIAMLTETVLK